MAARRGSESGLTPLAFCGCRRASDSEEEDREPRLSGPALLKDADRAVLERAADSLHCAGVNSKPFGNDAHTGPPRSRQRVRTSELTVFGAARPPARFSTIFPQRWNATGELLIFLSSVSIHAARYSPSLSLRRHTQPLPARRTFFAPIERSARAWLTICVAVGQRPA